MKTILVPTDFSANANNALAYAAQLASVVKGKIILCHALGLSSIGLPEEAGVIEPTILLKAGYQNELEKISKALRLEHGFRFEVETVCEEGPLFQCIDKTLANHQVDLVVMGTRGANNFLDKLIGTNTVSIIQDTNHPVLAIPAHATYKGFKQIAYASDFEKDEKPFLRQLFHLLEPFQTEVKVVNVRTDEQLDIVADEQIVEEIAQEFDQLPYSICQVLAPSVLSGIKGFTADNEVDVLAVGLEKQNCFEAFFHTSVTSQLAFESTTPLLVLPQIPAQAGKPVSKRPATIQPSV